MFIPLNQDEIFKYMPYLKAKNDALKEENDALKEENNYLKERIKVISDELFCKDRKLEELGVPIECCDKK